MIYVDAEHFHEALEKNKAVLRAYPDKSGIGYFAEESGEEIWYVAVSDKPQDQSSVGCWYARSAKQKQELLDISTWRPA